MIRSVGVFLLTMMLILAVAKYLGSEPFDTTTAFVRNSNGEAGDNVGLPVP